MTTVELAERIAKRLSIDLVGCKVGAGTQNYVRDIILDEISKFEKDKQIPQKESNRSYEL